MKTAFIITSAIDINENDLSNSAFTNEERFRQTVFTIACLDLLSNKDNIIFLIDSSENHQLYNRMFKYQTNLVYISVKEEFPDIYSTVRNRLNDPFSETLLIIRFIEKYKLELEKFDFTFKLSGRFFTDGSFKNIELNQDTGHKLFFKLPLKFEWNDKWPYSMVDRRHIQEDNKLYQYSSIMHGWSRSYQDRILDIYRVINNFIDQSASVVYDVDTLLYFFTRPYEKDILEVDWKVYGWDSLSGTYLRY